MLKDYPQSLENLMTMLWVREIWSGNFTFYNLWEPYIKRQYTEYKDENIELRALRGYFGPPMRPKNEIRFSPYSSD